MHRGSKTTFLTVGKASYKFQEPEFEKVDPGTKGMPVIFTEGN